MNSVKIDAFTMKAENEEQARELLFLLLFFLEYVWKLESEQLGY